MPPGARERLRQKLREKRAARGAGGTAGGASACRESVVESVMLGHLDGAPAAAYTAALALLQRGGAARRAGVPLGVSDAIEEEEEEEEEAPPPTPRDSW